ncbi:uncharacterized protein LOC129595584 [Paramacrobiotus metropolitanus]|uniref:uncharacterized protein LOC129595584 n=1 Tax=Paramacrobiotus metropolitanus TaxID=2943436 RepID=UPI002445E251|nr:uncharacterized protein LOC129595584 [Paramacrobiotus metropolitanus]
MRIYVGNLPNGYRLSELIELFENYGCVSRATAIRDFAFLAIYDRDTALNAINGLNNCRFGNNDIIVEPARFIRNRFPGYRGNSGRYYANQSAGGSEAQDAYYAQQGDAGTGTNEHAQQAEQGAVSYQGDNQNVNYNPNYNNNQQYDESQAPGNQQAPARGRGRGRGRGQTFRRSSRNYNQPAAAAGNTQPQDPSHAPATVPTEPANQDAQTAPGEGTPTGRGRGRGRGGRRGGRGRRGRGGHPDERRDSTANQSAPPGNVSTEPAATGAAGGSAQRPADVAASIGGAGDGVQQPGAAALNVVGKAVTPVEKAGSSAGGGGDAVVPVTAAC